MNKKEFIDCLAKAGNFNNEVAGGVYKVFVETLKAALLLKNEKVAIPELGKFEIKKRKPRNCINPNTKEIILVPEKTVIVFKAAKEIVSELNK